MAAAASNVQSFSKGEMIFREGDLGNEMYIIRSGHVEVVRAMGDGEVVLEDMHENEFFGEMSLFGEPKRGAGVRATRPTELFVINRKLLEMQFRKIPDWLVTMIKTVAQRILSTGKGIKVQFPLGLQYSLLNIVQMLVEDIGQKEEKGMSLPLDTTRAEVVNILGADLDEIDFWLKKLDFTNLVKIKGSINRLMVPDAKRLEYYLIYLKAKKKGEVPKDLDPNVVSSFERITKLLSPRK